MKTNCPNCGSNILDSDGICKYCGTRIINYQDICDSKFIYIKIKDNYLKCKCEELSLSISPDSCPVINTTFSVMKGN